MSRSHTAVAADAVDQRAGGPSLAVAMAGIVPAGPSGVRDYGYLLSAELRRSGYDVEEQWITSDGHRLTSALPPSIRFLWWAIRRNDRRPLAWHYSSMAHTARGIPLPGVLFGLALHARRVPLVTILHEPAYPWGRRGWRGRVQAATQWLVLPVIVAGSHSVVVTTKSRAERLQGLPRPLRRPVHVIPVFSTLGVTGHAEVATAPTAEATVGVLGYSGDGARPDVAVAALASLKNMQPRVVLLGAPGPGCADVARWRELAAQAGLGDRLEVSGILSADELSRRLMACDIVLLPNDEGPSGRRTTLAVALAHGLPVLTFDGPESWDDLVAAGAVLTVPPETPALAQSLADLCSRPQHRKELGDRGRRFYERHMTVERVAAAVAELLDQAAAATPR